MEREISGFFTRLAGGVGETKLVGLRGLSPVSDKTL
jgi:hypothetical protein